MRTNVRRSFMQTLESYDRLYPQNKTVLNLESIAFQKNDSFGPMLEAAIGKYKELIDAGAKKPAIKKSKDIQQEIESIIKSRLGLNVVLHPASEYLAATMPNIFVPHNVMIRDDIRWIFDDYQEVGGQKSLAKLKDKAVLGTVNTETAKVTGWFSQQKIPVFIDFYDLFKKFDMTVPEVTAVLLHELGHDFEGASFCSNVNTTNQVLADIARHLQSKDSGGDVEYIYSKVKSVYPEASRDIAESLASGNKVVMNVATYRLFVGVVQTLMADKTYDRTSYEALSDQFATRFGYGLQLVTALQKLEKKYPEYEFMVHLGTAATIVGTYCAFMSLGLTAIALSGGSAAIFAAAGAFMFMIFTKMVLDTQRTSTKDRTYDNIRDRYMRIRSQLVQFIKDPDIDTSARVATLANIQTIDTIVSNARVYESWIERLSFKFIPSDRRAKENIVLQQEMEKMIANDIFVAANRLSAASE